MIIKIMSKQKIKSKSTVLVSVHGKKEIGVIKKTYTKKGVQYFDVLLERGTFLHSITNNPEYSEYVIDSTKKIQPTINPDEYNFEIPDDDNRILPPIIFTEE